MEEESKAAQGVAKTAGKAIDAAREAGSFIPRFVSGPATLDQEQSFKNNRWYQFRVAYIPLLAALHWRFQVPREILVKHAMAVAGYDTDAATTPTPA